jgi:ubiquinone/menaquinone biosynthesis C-methylase UbiE
MRRWIIWLYEQGYTNLAWSYDLVTWLGSGGFSYKWILSAERYVAQGPVLELGFGRGRLLARLAEQGFQVLGVDRSEQMAKAAQGRLLNARGTAQVTVGVGQVLPIANGGVGTVVTIFPTAYVYDRSTQQEIARVLKDKGRWIWVDAPFAHQFTLRIILFGIMSYLAGIESVIFRSTHTRPRDKVLAVLGLSAHKPTWRPRLPDAAPFDIAVEQFVVGATAVHVAVLRKKQQTNMSRS